LINQVQSMMAVPVQTSPSLSAISISPTSSSVHDRFRLRTRSDPVERQIRQPKVLHPVENEDLKLLLVENISQEAVRAFRDQGFHVDHHPKAMSEDELVAKLGSYHAIGIRSKTKITQRVIQAAPKVRYSLNVFPVTSD
jgi:D-3-phosphoglycerate dehydrogenase